MPHAPEETVESLGALLERLPDDLRREALTHAAWAAPGTRSYERLAFLGDSVLSLSVSTHLLPRFEQFGAGRLTKLRAQAVSQQACAAVAEELEVPERLHAVAPGAPAKSAESLIASDRVLASVCEAVIGACYLAFGFERVAPAVAAAFEPQVEHALDNPVDYKSRLQERLARRADVVAYRIDSEEGPPHDRSFVAVAEVRGEEIGRGEGRSKKSAEQEAALRALDTLDAA